MKAHSLTKYWSLLWQLLLVFILRSSQSFYCHKPYSVYSDTCATWWRNCSHRVWEYGAKSWVLEHIGIEEKPIIPACWSRYRTVLSRRTIFMSPQVQFCMFALHLSIIVSVNKIYLLFSGHWMRNVPSSSPILLSMELVWSMLCNYLKSLAFHRRKFLLLRYIVIGFIQLCLFSYQTLLRITYKRVFRFNFAWYFLARLGTSLPGSQFPYCSIPKSWRRS